jgi:hypothetical protein
MRWVPIALVLAFAGSPAFADHHLVKRALQEARCTPASLKQVVGPPGALIYEARCTGPSQRTLTLVCTSKLCFPDDHSAHGPEDED